MSEQKTTVVHCKKSQYTTYIGRPSKWGNKFTHIQSACKPGMVLVESREVAIEKYREWIKTQPQLLRDLHELKGKVLGCWCKPKSCHGDVLAELAEQAVKEPFDPDRMWKEYLKENDWE